jgi:hypothetical protein
MRASAAGHTSGIPRSPLIQRKRLLVLAAAGLAIVLLAFGGAYLIAQSVGGASSKNVWTNVGQAPSSGDSNLVPHSSNGFTVMVPAGWTQSWQNSDHTLVRFYADNAKDKGVFLQLHVESAGKGDQRHVWEAAERRQQKSTSQYERVGDFAASRIGDKDGLDWEWRYTTDRGQRRHLLWRGVVIGGKTYQIDFSAPDDKYAAGVGVLDDVARSFRVSG